MIFAQLSVNINGRGWQGYDEWPSYWVKRDNYIMNIKDKRF